MQQLSVVALSPDGSRLVLIDDAGTQFAVPVDSRLRAALRGDDTRFGQLEIPMDSALRPRDIQARIRAGESAEDVAQAAQTTVDKVMVFAGPVLAERAHIADRAQRSSLRRGPDSPAGAPRALGDAVAEVLRTHNTDPATVEWDAWRREDGRWRLVADYRIDDRSARATFTYDVPGQYVVAEDDAARILIGEKPPRAPKPPAPTGPRRLSAVADHELPLGDAPLDPPSDDSGESGLGDDAIALVHDLDQEVEEVTRLRSTPAPQTSAETGTGDPDREATTDLTDTAEAVRRAAQAPPAANDPSDARDAGDEADAPAEPPAEPEKPARAGRKRRSSVPSWDEIMFGGGGSRPD